MDFKEFFTWEYIATFAGCMACTGVITQFIKNWLDSLVHIPTQLLAYLVALVVLLAAQAFTGALTASMAALDLLNAVLIAAAASGTYDGIRRIGGGDE